MMSIRHFTGKGIDHYICLVGFETMQEAERTAAEMGGKIVELVSHDYGESWTQINDFGGYNYSLINERFPELQIYDASEYEQAACELIADCLISGAYELTDVINELRSIKELVDDVDASDGWVAAYPRSGFVFGHLLGGVKVTRTCVNHMKDIGMAAVVYD